MTTMKLPLTVTFRGMAPSEWIEADVRRRAAKLDAHCRDIMSCRVVVEIPHRHHAEGNRLSVRLDITVPRDEIAVTRDANLHTTSRQLGTEAWVKRLDIEGTRKDIRVVLRDVFDVARRRLQDYSRRRLDVNAAEKLAARGRGTRRQRIA